MKIIIDLHAAPGSQNGLEHSSSRDGSQEWGLTDETIQESVSVIDFLTARYAKSPSLYAVELLNEPLAPGATLDMLNEYYKAGYNAIREHSSTAYVVMSNRIGGSNSTELFPVTSGLTRAVIDVHYYNLFSDIFDNMTVQQNIDFININRTAQLNQVTTSNGPLTLVGKSQYFETFHFGHACNCLFICSVSLGSGEWVAEWQVRNATTEDYQRFAKAQLEVYERASFGWAYWTLKNVNNHWSLDWMIKNGYIKL